MSLSRTLPRTPSRSPSVSLARLTARRFLIASLACSVFGGVAAAQMVSLAPADSVLVLRYAAGGSAYPSLEQDLRSLDTEALASVARSALTTLIAVADEDQAADLEDLLGLFDGVPDPTDALASVCPAAAGAPLPAIEEGMLSLSISSFAPVPAANLAVRVAADDEAALGQLLAALVGCFGSAGTQLEQDGTPLYVLGDGSDQPVTVARRGALLVASTQVNAARGMVRRALGAREPSLADSELGALPTFTGSGLSVALRPALLADLLDGLGGMVGPEFEPAVQRVSRALRTVPYAAARVQARPEGLVGETWLGVDATAGDPELAALLRCDGCRTRPSLLVPASALGVASYPLRLRAWSDYLVGLVEDVARSLGQDIDVRQALRDELGLDLDRDLFGYLGERADLVTLPPDRGNLEGLVGQPAMAWLVPVRDASEARAGLERLSRSVARLLEVAEDDLADAANLSLEDLVAVRTASYRGVAYDRLQYGPTTDIAVGFVGDRLVIATPAAGLEPLVDTYLGGPNLFDDAAFRAILRQSPDAVRSFSMLDQGATVGGLEPLLASLAQPAAFALQAGLAAASADLQEDLEANEATGDVDPEVAAALQDVPGFADTLRAAELPAAFVRVVAEHLGVSRGWHQTTDDGVYGYTLLPID